MIAKIKTLAKMISSKPESKAAVVIPIYKPSLSDYETIALDRCLKVLGQHPIVVVAPDGLPLDSISLLKLHEIKIVRFPKHFFASISGYNSLMLSIDFYETFLPYRFILVYQLDAFVFSDQLMNWCALSHDYIGAPWIQNDWLESFNQIHYGYLWKFLAAKKRAVGNGGFSLRNVRSFIIALMLLESSANRWRESNNEDLFWSFAVPEYLPWFSIPSIEGATKFAFEDQPQLCYTQNGQSLPFGCHAWEKHDKAFWRPFFKGFGYDI
jgi:hypothetical protein